MEAEGRALRRATLRTGLGLICLLVAALLLLVGIGFALWACYQWFALSMGTIAAAAVIGLFMMVLAGGLAWTAIRINR